MSQRTRQSEDNKVTDNDIIALGFSVAGLAGLGDSYHYSKGDEENHLLIQIWNDRYVYKYAMYYDSWPANSKRVDSGTVTTYEDLMALISLGEEILEDDTRH